MKEQVLVSLITASSPLILSFIFKRIDTKNETSFRVKKMEEVQKKLDFLNNYYKVQSELLDATQLSVLKKELSEDAALLRSQIHFINKEPKHFLKNELTGYQRIFISFKPLTFMGWIWLLLFYANLIFLSFAFLGFGLDENQQVSFNAFKKNMGDTNAVLGTGIFVLLMLMFRWFALMSYDKTFAKKITPNSSK